MRFKAHRAIITGASRGLGEALARNLYAEGASVCLLARSEDRLESLASELRATGSREQEVLAFPVDVQESQAVEAAFEDLGQRWPSAHLLINNAGSIVVEPLATTSNENWLDQMGVNLNGTFFCSRAFVIWCLKKSQSASILNVSSLAGVQGVEKFPGFCSYSAAKAGVIGLTEAAAVELQPQNILVNCVAPGAVNTQMLREALPDFKTSTTPESVAAVILDRIAEAEQHRLTGKLWSLENA